MEAHERALLERIAVGIEKLADDPILEMEVHPPVCPHCNKFNPMVNIAEGGGIGRLFEFYIETRCQECGETFYVVPMQYSLHMDKDTLRVEIQERADKGGGDNGTRIAGDNATTRVAS